jgi:hypothetical protein
VENPRFSNSPGLACFHKIFRYPLKRLEIFLDRNVANSLGNLMTYYTMGAKKIKIEKFLLRRLSSIFTIPLPVPNFEGLYLKNFATKIKN